MIDKIFSDSAVTASTITSVVALIGIVIGAINYTYQNSQKNKADYQKMIKEKLEYFYAPLYLKYSIDLNYMITKDQNMMSRITNYNYLIDVNTKNLLTLIIAIETKTADTILSIDGTNNTLQSEKLRKYKESLLKYISTEYLTLSSCYEKVHEDMDFKYRNNSNKSIINIAIKIVKMMTIVFILFFLFLLVYSYFIEKGSSLILKEIILPFVLLICCYGTALYLGDLFSIIWDHIRKTLHHYTPNESVPIEGEYKCVYCTKKEYFYNDTIFTACPNANNHKNILKSFSRWKKA